MSASWAETNPSVGAGRISTLCVRPCFLCGCEMRNLEAVTASVKLKSWVVSELGREGLDCHQCSTAEGCTAAIGLKRNVEIFPNIRMDDQWHY